MPSAVSKFCQRLGPIVTSLLLGVAPLAQPAQAAQELVVRLDGLTLPLEIDQLAAWARDPAHPQGDLGVWFDLLEPSSRADLLRLLRAPLVQDRSLARQLIESWAGEQVLGAMGELISGDTLPAAWQPLAAETDSRPPQALPSLTLTGLPLNGLPLNRSAPTGLAPAREQPTGGLDFGAPPGPLPPLPATASALPRAQSPAAQLPAAQAADLQAGGPLLLKSLSRLLEHRQVVTTIDLLQAVPTSRIHLNLDALVAMAGQWRQQLEAQRQALAVLRRLPLQERGPLLPITDGLAIASSAGSSAESDATSAGTSSASSSARSAGSSSASNSATRSGNSSAQGPASRSAGLVALVPRQAAGQGPSPLSGRSQVLSLAVPHRSSPLQLVLWPAQATVSAPGWVLLMPGLGGSASQLGWLGAALAERGWPVVVLEHPGSDEQAVRALLDGRQPPPGAETLPIRLQDVQAVVAAEQAGRLPPLGRSVVLMGHSFGGLTALLAAGLRPEADLAGRCRRAMRQLPLTNLSRLLQCQLARVTLPAPQPLAQPVAGLVIFNGFGSLLWPNRGLAGLDAPVLLVGGSLDLVTPPLGEQLELFLPEANPRNRLALVDGASHFSPVRIRPGSQALFQLGEDLVGLAPERVQGMELSLTSEFLLGLKSPMALPPQRRKLGGVNAYVLDRAAAVRWRAALKT